MVMPRFGLDMPNQNWRAALEEQPGPESADAEKGVDNSSSICTALCVQFKGTVRIQHLKLSSAFLCAPVAAEKAEACVNHMGTLS